MPTEIERKFLLKNDAWKAMAGSGVKYIQGYLIGSKLASVRVRVEGEKSYLNIKSATLGVRRQEYEYPIPLEEAKEMLNTLCGKPLIEKTRYFIEHKGLEWEIDEFEADNDGLVVAEVELESEDQVVDLPDWCGTEVSDDPRYYNVSLVKYPYSKWT